MGSVRLDMEQRRLLDQLFDRWSLLVLDELCQQPRRFSELKGALTAITSKSLTETLRRLQRNGLVVRTVLPDAPIAVSYCATDLARTLEEPVRYLMRWIVDHADEVTDAQARAEDTQTAALSAPITR